MASTTNYPPLLCAKGCGFYGSKETKNLCSKCYNDFLREGNFNSAETKVQIQSNNLVSIGSNLSSSLSSDSISSTVTPNKTNRCQSCKKKVGLLGFSCRCGQVLCGLHRYPKEHSCTFDFKTADRLRLAQDNPVVKADKLDFHI